MISGWESAIIIALFGLFIWSVITIVSSGGMVMRMKRVRGEYRAQDLFSFITTSVVAVILGIVLFIYPGWIYKLPAVIVCLEVSFGALLFYISERQVLDWLRLKSKKRFHHHHPHHH